MKAIPWAVAAFVLSISTAAACTFCAGSYANRQTIREQAKLATIVVHGRLNDPRLLPGGLSGETDLTIGSTLKTDPAFGTKKSITIPHYLPVIGDTPRDYLLFAAWTSGKADVIGGMSLAPAAVDYVKGALALPADQPDARLGYYFHHLESADPAIAGDAFCEFAKASDRDIIRAAAKLDPVKLSQWLTDPKTPADRLGVYAMLLGLCGKPPHAATFRELLNTSPRPERIAGALGGLLAGLTLLDPKAGWDAMEAFVTNAKAPFDERLAAISSIRYFQSLSTDDRKQRILAIYSKLTASSDLADVVAEDLRRWGWWNLTADVLAPFDQPTHKAPIIRQAIVRYALTCSDESCRAFLTKARATDPKLVARVEEGLKHFQKPK